ncbi:hypothetical protein FSP39_012040 [Pinctada imbricata]|uniref:Zinc finger MYM-type 1-like n=1 Tax=Pinctada imbricata TaxID=66713 RepID=A0AA88YER3_PINIB|nr:hypothetical protein FSP39_012040 [Pinctada imbricata]
MATRGHHDSEGNFIQLLRLRAEDNPLLQTLIENGRYLSPEIVNEQISLIGQNILRHLLDSVKTSKWYSVMADECMDVSYEEQLVICVRWVDSDLQIHEDMLGLLKIESQTSNYITAAIKDILLRCGLPLELCRGQAYDGAPNMSGHLSGVAKQIQDQSPSALGVHCLAHCINLCVQDVTKKCQPVRDSMDLVIEIEKLICLSPKRSNLFLEQKQLHGSAGSPNLRPICPTRWTVRTYAIESVLKNYKVLQETLDNIHKNTRDEYSRRAGGQLAMMDKFSTFFGLKLSHLIFAASEQLSLSVQGKETSAHDANKAAKATESYFERQRQESVFNKFYESVIDEAKDLTDPPTLPRYRRIPKRVDDGTEQHRFDTVKGYYRQQYYEALDLAKGELNARFDQKNMSVVQEIEALLLSAANGEDVSIPSSVADLYKNDISLGSLETQLKLLPGIFKDDDSKIKIKRVTLIDTISTYMLRSEANKRLLSDVYSLLKIYLTIPVTTATAERAFSSLRRIKTYLRSTMTQARLNHCMLGYVHKELTDNVDVKEIASNFIKKFPLRQVFFGNV